MLAYRFAVFLAFLQLSTGNVKKRPFYIIAHMANSISTMDKFIRKGANAIEVDIAFDRTGVPKWVYHGVPCDAFRRCHESTPLDEFLRAAARRNLTLVVLDLKSSKLTDEAKERAGQKLARTLCHNFDIRGGDITNVILSVPSVRDKPLLSSYIDEMKLISPWKLSSKTSFDVSVKPDFMEVSEMFHELDVDSAWQGDGVTNWFESTRSFGRIRDAVKLRDTGHHYIKKVYRWTVDGKKNIRKAIELGCDAVMTNYPSRASKIVEEFEIIRLAKRSDYINGLYSP